MPPPVTATATYASDAGNSPSVLAPLPRCACSARRLAPARSGLWSAVRSADDVAHVQQGRVVMLTYVVGPLVLSVLLAAHAPRLPR